MKNKINYQEIEQYISQTLTEQEKLRFEEKIKKDELLFKEVALVKQIIKGIRILGRKETVEKLNKLSLKMKAEGFFYEIEDIEAYLSDRFNSEQKIVFEKRMNTDDEFKKEVNGIKQTIAGIKQHGNDKVKSKLASIQAKLEKEQFFDDSSITTKEGNIFSFRKIMAAAAILSAIVSVGIWLWNSSSSNKEIFAQHFSPYPDIITPEISESSFAINKDEVKQLSKGMTLYREKKYAAAQIQFDAILNNFPSSEFTSEIFLYRAILFLDQGKDQAAIDILQNLEKEKESYFLSVTRWYLALSYLKTGQEDRAKPIFELLKADGGYSEKVREILEDLK